MKAFVSIQSKIDSYPKIAIPKYTSNTKVRFLVIYWSKNLIKNAENTFYIHCENNISIDTWLRIKFSLFLFNFFEKKKLLR